MTDFFEGVDAAIEAGDLTKAQGEALATEYALGGARAALAMAQEMTLAKSVTGEPEPAPAPAADSEQTDPAKLAEDKQDLADLLMSEPQSERCRALLQAVARSEAAMAPRL